jgi:Arginase family
MGAGPSRFADDAVLVGELRAAAEEGAFPLVLAGNCNSCPGTVAGLDPAAAAVGVVWFDAHPDFDTPDRSLGFFDGMGLAILTGNGWDLLRATIPGFVPVAERDVVLVGVRDFEPHQRASLEASGLRVLAGSSCTPAERRSLRTTRRWTRTDAWPEAPVGCCAPSHAARSRDARAERSSMRSVPGPSTPAARGPARRALVAARRAARPRSRPAGSPSPPGRRARRPKSWT